MAGLSAEFAAHLRPGDTILVGNGTAEPAQLIAGLIARAREMQGGLRVIQVTTSGAEALAQTSGDGFRLATPAPGRLTRAAIGAGRADLIPESLGMLAGQIARGDLRIDGVLLRTGPATAGIATPGLAMDLSAPAFARARFRLLEVDAALPEIPSRQGYALGRCDLVLHTQQGAEGAAEKPPMGAAAVLAGHVADCIPPQATLEVGLGRLGALLPAALAGRRGHALATGLIGDEARALVEQGIVDRAVAPHWPEFIRAAVIRGSAGFYAWCHRNPLLCLADATETHDPARLASLHRFTALNGALQVDLMGNANSLAIGGRLLGGLGGAIDYATAGAYAAGSIIALESRGAAFSRIVPQVEQVTIPCAFVTHVVTEFGVARLRGRSLAERAAALIGVAHPDFRDELRRAARRLDG